MGPLAKILIGLAATMLMGWVHHAPLGNGERLISGLEGQAKAAAAQGQLPGIAVRMDRDPLARRAILSGTANQYQREGFGSQKGLKDYVSEVEGISGVQWADEPGRGVTLPLIAETLLLLSLAYLIGLGLGWLVWGRRRRESYLGD